MLLVRDNNNASGSDGAVSAAAAADDDDECSRSSTGPHTGAGQRCKLKVH